jgi:hypothetical protein
LTQTLRLTPIKRSKTTFCNLKVLHNLSKSFNQKLICRGEFWFHKLLLFFNLLLFIVFLARSPSSDIFFLCAHHSIRFFLHSNHEWGITLGNSYFECSIEKANNKFKSQIIFLPFFPKYIQEISSLSERASGRREKLLRLLANINLYVFDYVWILHSVYVLLQAWKAIAIGKSSPKSVQ